ncbi:RagB/SusD family nutrient uptake outer membrane protein [Sphingobacterium psychroaquaticum]|uniref:Starch-binding associating with outer membrane n=1 Tax=Sphingobacterium psychroaquaticum TaxID=561061 RepID=A0A1X7KIY4_9SPHI|nr:RagB/SusD family nutrient uptake outer membrane protein [Sphingobacterium psychroaquaticum]QBQ42773.1 RagB/SusD family nutrient uptake outer membrane protein [Sphingobacterium psychroaquaticum]SMG40581.1 Starch-binding associating with outer membrane [Sphingobacterium psychroaquaticum]
MKNIKQIRALLAGTMLLSSVGFFQACKIDIPMVDRYVEEDIWNDPTSAEFYVNGLYAEFKNFQFGLFPGLGYDNATDAMSDIMKYTSTTAGNGTVNILVSNANQFSAGSVGLNYWTTGYARIRRINEFMDGLVKKSKLSDEQKIKYEAEARFVRGYTYFWLMRIHGSVILRENLEQYANKDQARASEDECWNFIAKDFAFAAENLGKTNLAGRATKGAAYGMLARTWIYAASIAENDRKQFNSDPLTGISQEKAVTYYTNAMNAANQVVSLANEGLYDLDADFASIFTNKNTKEAIFRVDFVAPQMTHQYDLGFAPPADAPGNTLVYGVPTAELVNEFEMADGTKFSWTNPVHSANPYANREPRFYATVLHHGATWKGRTLNLAESNSEGFMQYASMGDPKRTVTGYYAKKMLDPKNTNFVVNKSTQSWIELRYAEVLLILAEAQAGTNQLTEAVGTINKLRSKRGLPEVFSNTKGGVMALVEHERKVELAFEGHRFWDLRRWRKAHLVLNGVRFTGHKFTGSSYQVVSADNIDRSFTGALYYLPIPEAEVQRNNALEQIKGW